MKINFWLNTPSPHLAGLLTALSSSHEVTIITQSDLSLERIKMGWQIPNVGSAKFMDINKVSTKSLFLLPGVNIFSGFFSYKSLLLSTVCSLFGKHSHTFFILEKPAARGAKAYLVRFKYRFLNLIFGGKVDGFLSLGAGSFLRRINIKKPILETCYISDFESSFSEHNNERNIAFVGQLVKRKNLLSVIKALNVIKFDRFKVIGEGPELSSINEKVALYHFEDKYEYSPFVKNYELKTSLKDYNTIVLPSYKEGWGVIVNEALLMGKKVVLCSSCGCARYFSILNQCFVFDYGDEASLVAAIKNAFDYKVTKLDFENACDLLSADLIAANVQRFLKENK